MENKRNLLGNKRFFIIAFLVFLIFLPPLALKAQTAQYSIYYSFVVQRLNKNVQICDDRYTGNAYYYYRLHLIHNNEIRKKLWDEGIGCKYTFNGIESGTFIIPKDNYVTKYRFEARARERAGNVGACAAGCTDNERYIDGTQKDIFSINHSQSDYAVRIANDFHDVQKNIFTYTYCSIVVTPLLNLQGTGAPLTNDTPLMIVNAVPGFNTSTYNWQYNIPPSSEWKNVPTSYSWRNTLVFSGKQLLGYDDDFFAENTGKIIYFRILLKDDNAPVGRRESPTSPIGVSIAISAPRITSVSSKSVRCYGDQNGEIKVDFSRKLYPNETLKINITGTNNGENRNVSLSGNNYQNSFYTIQNLPAGSYRIQLSGIYRQSNGDYNTYTDTNTSTGNFAHIVTVESPMPFRYNGIIVDDVTCHNGQNGKITINIMGGTLGYGRGSAFYKKVTSATDLPMYWGHAYQIDWAKDSLSAGQYKCYVIDNNGCRLKDTIITIKQPVNPVQITNPQFTEPLAYGYSDGKIKITVSGGTTPYTVIWYDSLGNSSNITSYNGNEYTANGLKAGLYNFVATDSKYRCGSGSVTNNCAGCRSSNTFRLLQPPPLIVTPYQYDSVKCHNGHEASLYAVAEGGVPFVGRSDSSRYNYQWFKKNESGTFDSLPNQTDTITRGLNSGTYMIQITDKNGIEKSAEIFVSQPDSLELQFEEIQASCGEANGSITVQITGGSVPYYIEWGGNGDSTATLTSLRAGFYGVFATDRNSCKTYDIGHITTPTNMQLTDIVIPVKCYNGCNGVITQTIAHGVPPYSAQWVHDASLHELTISGLCAGDYKTMITDSIGCVLIKEYSLTNPAPVVLSLPDTITLCIDQTYTADAGEFSTYAWRKGSQPNPIGTDREIRLVDEGRYFVEVTIENGCPGYDSLYIERSNKVIISDFLAATQIGRLEVIRMINISYPRAEKYEWLFPADIVQIKHSDSSTIDILFTDTGNYIVHLKAMEGKCVLISDKKITVMPEVSLVGTVTSSPMIKTFTVQPNPNSGSFLTTIELAEEAPICLRLVGMNSGQIVYEIRRDVPASYYEIPFSLPLSAGVYILRLETIGEMQALKIIIQQ